MSKLATMTEQHHIRVNVSPAAFAANIRHLRALAHPSKVCVVMKANAYGHGLRPLASVAIEAGADYLGICTNPEAALIREAHREVKIMRLRAALPEELDESVAALGVEEQLGSVEAAEYLDRAGRRAGRPVPIHLKIDTGMGRSGFFPEQLETIKRVCVLPGLKLVGIMTHLAKADAPDLGDAQRQLDAFWALRESLRNVLPEDVLVHTHNSAATVRLGDRRADLVRVGAACYGVRTSRHFENPTALRPVMSVFTRVAQVRSVPADRPVGYGTLYRTGRPSRLASLPVGFGEGYPRALFNKGVVLIHGQRCPVVGRVSLNVLTVDVTDAPCDVRWGDEAVLIGRQASEEVTFEELADRFDSVHTEINLMAGSMNRVTYAD